MLRLVLCLLLVSLSTAVREVAGADAQTAAPTSKTLAALAQSFRTNLGYCDQWINAKDFKSLAKTVTELPILVAALNRYIAESDRGKSEALRPAVSALAAAAKNSDLATAKSSMTQLKTALDAVADAKPADTPKPIEKAPGGFGPLMALMDGTFADAKTAATIGDAAEAKQAALTLVELSQYLAIDRNDERWRKQSQELAAAASEAAASNTTDAKELRRIFHTVYDRCEACHAVRRPSNK